MKWPTGLTNCYLNFNSDKMKELKEFINYAKEEPRAFIGDLLGISFLFGFFYFLLLFAAILEGNA